MSVTEGQIRGKYHQDTNVPRSNPAISQIHKNIERHTTHTIDSWPNPKRWVIVHTSDLMMIIRQSTYILSIIRKEMGKLKTHSRTYYLKLYIGQRKQLIAKPAITNCMASRHDNSRCHQRRKSCQIDDPCFQWEMKNIPIILWRNTMYISVNITVKLCVNIMLIEHWKQKIVKPTTLPSPPMAPQIVLLTTTTRDEKAANLMIPCYQWEKKTKAIMIW